VDFRIERSRVIYLSPPFHILIPMYCPRRIRECLRHRKEEAAEKRSRKSKNAKIVVSLPPRSSPSASSPLTECRRNSTTVSKIVRR